MRLIERYIYKEYLHAAGYCLSAFAILFVITDLFSRLGRYLSADTPKYLILQIYLFKLSVTLEFIVPACLMLATLYTLWQLTRHNELIAMRASGISLLHIIKPFIVVGICFSLAMILVKEYATPYTTMWLRKLSDSRYVAAAFEDNMNRSLENFPYANTDDHRLWTIGELSPKKPELLKNVTILTEKADGRRHEKLYSDRAEWLDGQWWFHNATIQRFDDNDNPIGKPFAPIPGENTILEVPEFYERPSDFISSARSPEFLSSRALLRFLETHKFLPDAEKARIRVDFHSRIAMPWACLIATLFAIPVGTKSSRQSVLTNIFMAIGYLFLFYATIQLGMILGKKQVLSPWLGAWFSNIVFFATGIFMTRKII